MAAANAPRKQTLVVAAKLHKNQLERHLELFEHIPEVGRVCVVRREPLPDRLSKLENFSFSPSHVAVEAIRMSQVVRRVATEERAEWLIGFNPVPWGSLAALATIGLPTKVCLSLIGLDFQQVQRPWGRPFLEAVRRADAVTVTGDLMIRRLTELGVRRDRLFVLPHSVDTERFRPNELAAEELTWDIVAVGQLIRRKRMDVLIDALSVLRKRNLTLRLGILGKGELEAALRQQVRDLGLDEQVDFLGYRDNVEEVLRRAGIFCLASEWEGVPFAMMEAMACGLVPVVSDVGTIADWVEPRRNGMLVSPGDVGGLADALELMRPGSEPWRKAHGELIEERERLSFDHGASVWRRVLGLGQAG